MLVGSLWRHFLTYLQLPVDISSELSSSALFLCLNCGKNAQQLERQLQNYGVSITKQFKALCVQISVIKNQTIQTI